MIISFMFCIVLLIHGVCGVERYEILNYWILNMPGYFFNLFQCFGISGSLVSVLCPMLSICYILTVG